MDVHLPILLAAFDFGSMTPFLWVTFVLAGGMLIWDTIEVGRNDAANLVNAVFGARILSRRNAVWVAGGGAVLGACLASDVVETARKGIFSLDQLGALEDPIVAALSIYIAVYVVDTVLLYGYSSFGMPVSTTACLVFELLGAAFALGGFGIVQWPNAGKVIFAIVMSIFISAVIGFFVQRAVRGAIRGRSDRLVTLLLHGGWICGGMLAMLTYFMVIKGMKNVAVVKALNASFIQHYGALPVVIALWLIFAVAIHSTLVIYRKRAAKLLFPSVAIIGTFCMGVAFGQNDLANCAAPGLSALTLLQNREAGLAIGTAVPIAGWMLFGCGLLLLCGMLTKRAHRVTEAAVSAGSMSNVVAIYAPQWCLRIARQLIRLRGETHALAPSPLVPGTDETRDYDAVRACVILGVSASVIAMASSFGLPVSTTYVTFAAVIATGAGDRILQRGDADLKLARTIWIVFSWFTAAVIAAIAAGFVCATIYHGGVFGVAFALTTNFVIRRFLARRGDRQVKLAENAAHERLSPEEFVDDEG